MRLPDPASGKATLVILRRLCQADPPGLTLDLLRGRLSHEVAAKTARLGGLLNDWRQGRYRREDPQDASQILRDRESIFLAHARLAGARFTSFFQLLGVLATLNRMGGLIRPLARGKPLSLRASDRFGAELERLRAQGRTLALSISVRYGVPIFKLGKDILA